MKILIILLCITILFYNHKKEGFWNKWKKKLRQKLKQIKECGNKLIQHNSVIRERDMWRNKRKNLNRTYYDKNFKKRVNNVVKSDMYLLNNYINRNTSLNNDLNNMLTRIKIIQTNNKDLVDQLKTQNTYLKECKMNQELTNNDYDVLK